MSSIVIYLKRLFVGLIFFIIAVVVVGLFFVVAIQGSWWLGNAVLTACFKPDDAHPIPFLLSWLTGLAMLSSLLWLPKVGAGVMDIAKESNEQ